jgi:hypothetical protein
VGVSRSGKGVSRQRIGGLGDGAAALMAGPAKRTCWETLSLPTSLPTLRTSFRSVSSLSMPLKPRDRSSSQRMARSLILILPPPFAVDAACLG